MAGDLYKKPILFAIVAAVRYPDRDRGYHVHPHVYGRNASEAGESQALYGAAAWPARISTSAKGCNNCHTQTVRPLKTEVMRYGEYSKAGEFAYDRPFLWGSKRTGPDLARIGGKYPDAWHEIILTIRRRFSPNRICRPTAG